MDRPLRIGAPAAAMSSPLGRAAGPRGRTRHALPAGYAVLPPLAPWVLFGLWWLLGVLLLLRVPSVGGGPYAEERVLARLSGS